MFGWRYPDYVRRTTRQERLLYQYFLALESAKEQHALERQKLEADLERTARDVMVPSSARH